MFISKGHGEPLNEGDVRALLYASRRNLERAGMLAELVDYVEDTGSRMVARGQDGLKIIYSGEHEGRSGYILEDGRNRNNGPMGSEELAAVNTRFKAGLEAREQGRMIMNDRFRLGRP